MGTETLSPGFAAVIIIRLLLIMHSAWWVWAAAAVLRFSPISSILERMGDIGLVESDDLDAGSVDDAGRASDEGAGLAEVAGCANDEGAGSAEVD